MTIHRFIATAFLACAPVITFAQAPLLSGQLLLVDENGQATPAPGVDVTIAETGATDRTDAKGLFRIQLPKNLQAGSLVTLDAAKPGWVIWQPEEGKGPVPQGLLTVKLLPKGSKRLWTDSHIQAFIESTAEKAKLQVQASKPGEPPKPVDFAPLIRDWAVKYGFTPAEAKAQIDKWVADVETSQQDFYKLGLAAFAEHNFGKAGELLSEAGRNSEKKLRAVEKEQADLKAKRAALLQETIRNYKKEGDAHFSGYEFSKAQAAYEKALRFVDRRSEPALWAQTQVEIGMASAELATQIEGSEITRNFAEAMAAYRAALDVYALEQSSMDWAATQNNLCVALHAHGVGSAGDERRQSLAQAVAACKAALQVYTQKQSRQPWAAAENNLGTALEAYATLYAGPAGQELIAEAVSAFRSALEVYTQEQSPENWAGTQSNLGDALDEQGLRTSGVEEQQLLAQSIRAYRSALEVYTGEKSPQQWAATQNNLGTTLNDQGSTSPGEAGRELLSEAVSAFRAALEVRTREHLPQDWAMTQNNLGTALEEQGRRTEGDNGRQLLSQSVSAFRAALEVRTREQLPHAWAMTQSNLGNALKAQGMRSTGKERHRLLSEAVSALSAALEVRSRELLPQEWAATEYCLAEAYLAQADWTKAALTYRNVLEIFPDETAYRALTGLYVEKLFDYGAAVALQQSWIAAHPRDLLAQADLTEGLFTVGQFSAVESQASRLKDDNAILASTRAAVRALEIAALVARQQTETASIRIGELGNFVSAQPADFKITWTWNGTIHFVQTDDQLAARRHWIEAFFKALQAENRDAILASLNAVAQDIGQ